MGLIKQREKSPEEIIKSLFMTRKDFNVLVDLTPQAAKVLYRKIYNAIQEELKAEGVEMPDIYHLPTARVIEKLRKYGFNAKRCL